MKIFPWNGFQTTCEGQRTSPSTTLHSHGSGIEEQDTGGTDGKLPVEEWQVGERTATTTNSFLFPQPAALPKTA